MRTKTETAPSQDSETAKTSYFLSDWREREALLRVACIRRAEEAGSPSDNRREHLQKTDLWPHSHRLLLRYTVVWAGRY